MLKRDSNHNYLIYKGVICLPIMLYFVFLGFLSIDAPFGDDYDAILGFLVDFNGSVSEVYKFISRHAEHQIVSVKIVSYLYYSVTGEIDFVALIFIGNLSLFVIMFIFFKSEKNLYIAEYFPIPFLIFNFAFFQSSTWAMASLSNFVSVMFSFLALYLLSKSSDNNKIFGVALVCAMFALFSFGNGLFTYIAAIPILLSFQNKNKFIIWFLSFGGLLVLYCVFDPLVSANRPDISIKLESIIEMMMFFFTFIGSIFKVFYLAIMAGICIVGLFIYLIISSYFVERKLLLSFWIFLLLSAATAAYTRFIFGAEYATTSRYAFFSSLFMVLVYLALLSIVKNNFTKKKYEKCVMYFGGGIIAVYFSSFLFYPLLSTYYQVSNLPYTFTVYINSKEKNTNLKNELVESYKNYTQFYFSESFISYYPSIVKEKLQSKILQRSVTFKKGMILEGAIITSAVTLQKAEEKGIYQLNTEKIMNFLRW